jgi:hypothetical protein
MLNLLLLAAVSALVGTASGLAALWWFLARSRPNTAATVESADPFVSAEIDRAAATWASDRGRPEAAGIMADKLHLLYDLGRRRRRS